MGDGDLGLRHVRFQELLDEAEVGDARDDIEALAAAEPFAKKGFADGERVERAR
jgi:hypothetical protein